MDPINPLDKLTALLHRKIAEEAAAKTGRKSPVKTTEAQQQFQASKPSPEELRNKIVPMLKAIDANDPKRDQKMMHIFVENVLIWQFGEELLNDSAFSQLLSDVEDTLKNEPGIVKLLSEIR